MTSRKITRDDYRRRVREIDQADRGKPYYSPNYMASRLGIDPKTNRRYLGEYDVGWPPFGHEAPFIQEPGVRLRCYLEGALSIITLAFFAVTLAWNEWIELAFRVDLDLDDGSLENLICFVLGAVSIGSWWSARIEWRRVHGCDYCARME